MTSILPEEGDTPEGVEKEVVTREKEGMKIDLKIVVIIVAFIALLLLLMLLPGAPIEAYGISVRPGTFVLLIILVLVALMLPRALIKFLEYERGVVFRYGRFNRVAGPGWTLIFPIVEKYEKVDLRLHVYTIDPKEVVTKDKVRFLVSPEVFMYVSNPRDAIINIKDYKGAVLSYINSALTHICGNSPSDYIISHMDSISHMLEDSVHKISTYPGREWGIVVPKVKLTMVRFPEKVQSAMHEKVAAGQLKLAAHEKADAIKMEIDAIREAGGKLTDPAITYMYLEALDKVARGRATKIVLPLEISKIAETITKRTTQPTKAKIPVDMINYYQDVMDKYEKRIKDIENRLKEGEIKPEEMEEYRKEIEKEEEDYTKKIREIKKRLGLRD